MSATNPTRRAMALAALLAASPAALVSALVPTLITATAAQAQSSDVAFLQGVSQRLVSIVNGSGSHASKVAGVLATVDRDVAVDQIAQFCLGRYWRNATPAQQQRYTQLFHQALANSISDKLGAYEGLSLSVGQAQQRPDGTYVNSTLTRPGQADAAVSWKILEVGGQPKIADVVVEGISLALTQRQDYSAYLASHGGSVDALIAALKHQVDNHT